MSAFGFPSTSPQATAEAQWAAASAQQNFATLSRVPTHLQMHHLDQGMHTDKTGGMPQPTAMPQQQRKQKRRQSRDSSEQPRQIGMTNWSSVETEAEDAAARWSQWTSRVQQDGQVMAVDQQQQHQQGLAMTRDMSFD